MRLIDADALIERYKRHRNVFCKNRIEFQLLREPDKARVDELDNCIAGIVNAPTIEPERKKGEWIRENIVLTSNPPQYQWHCSECGKMVHWFTAEVLTDFCPNCGAEMRGEQP